MNAETRSWLHQLYEEKLQRPIQIGEVFTDYFGEEFVDVQFPNFEGWLNEISGFSFRGSVRVVGERQDFVIVTGSKLPTYSITREEWDRVRCTSLLDVLDSKQEYQDIVREGIIDALNGFLGGRRTTIIVHFPKVTVTNENDKSIEITGLYSKIGVSTEGKIVSVLRLFRTEYTVAQYLSGYAHSHLPGTSFEWQRPCLGSGPIRSTQNYLTDNFDLHMYGLFCYELSKYVTVESIQGTPYIRLESVGNYTQNRTAISFPTTDDNPIPGAIVRTFVGYFLRTQTIPIAYVNGKYTLGCHPTDFLINISRIFIRWYNDGYILGAYNTPMNTLIARGVIGKYIVDNKELYTPTAGRSTNDLASIQGRPLFIFKGQEVTLNFIDLNAVNDSNNYVILLSPVIVSRLLTHIFEIVNYEYGHETKHPSTEEGVATNKKHCFL